MTEIKVKLVRSRIGTTPAQRKMLDSLGLKRRETVKTFKDTPAISGHHCQSFAPCGRRGLTAARGV